MPQKFALISVSDKSGIVAFAQGLIQHGFRMIASGGTAKILRKAGLTVIPVNQWTSSPEILDGRVKTLHPAIHGGILSRRSPADRAELRGLDWNEIDLVAVNLYPFAATVASGAALDKAIEQIDIGGVALLRAAAKNFAHVTPLCDPADYDAVLAELANAGAVTPEIRRQLAIKAFAHTAAYDAAIHAYLLDQEQADETDTDPFPAQRILPLHKVTDLRYGENPHQRAALYSAQQDAGPLGGIFIQGEKPLSYNNLLDLDAAWRAASSFERPTVAIIKHLSPCGIASADTLVAAFPPALAGDPISAFGSVIAANRPVSAELVAAIDKLFVEAIIAPAFTPEAQTELARRKKNCRLVAVPAPRHDPLELRSIDGGVLIQERDYGDEAAWQVVTERAPTEEERIALRFAWRAIAHVKSNAILFAKGEAVMGIGGGQPSRVDAVKIAAQKAGERARGAVMASDAFFPFPDGIEVAAEAGVTAVIEPGGSIRDQQVIDAANRLGLAMVFTGYRHFRH
ncbi:MAG: bifunctional phosphoribosylaminoimidazolecarboxamide formyltransferase/IMP cyclohydrolase [Anaerolineales bacterium]